MSPRQNGTHQSSQLISFGEVKSELISGEREGERGRERGGERERERGGESKKDKKKKRKEKERGLAGVPLRQARA
jgi:hypothetical protein